MTTLRLENPLDWQERLLKESWSEESSKGAAQEQRLSSSRREVSPTTRLTMKDSGRQSLKASGFPNNLSKELRSPLLDQTMSDFPQRMIHLRTTTLITSVQSSLLKNPWRKFPLCSLLPRLRHSPVTSLLTQGQVLQDSTRPSRFLLWTKGSFRKLCLCRQLLQGHNRRPQ